MDTVKTNIQSYASYSDIIYVVDNSPEETMSNREIASTIEKCVYIYNGNKGGIAGAQNKACQQAIKDGYEWLMTMDQDAIFEAESPSYLLNKTKVYIDFGNHPGMDRIPREARMQGCVVITGKIEAANYFEDVPIEEQFERKTKNIKPISELIKSVFLDYEYWDKKQSDYTTFIKGQRDRFSEDVRIIFW